VSATARARLFVALELPEPVRAALVAWRAPLLRELGALRAVAPAALHVTLCFIGWREEASIASIAAIVERCAETCGEVSGLSLDEEPLWLPPRRARALTLGLADGDGRLGALRAELAGRLARDGWHEPETRPYLPHVTVARVRAGKVVPRRVTLPPAPALAFEGAAVVLYRSRLERAGARYEPLFVGRLA